MNKSDLLQRTKNFAIKVLRLLDKMPVTPGTKIISGQLGRSATSIAVPNDGEIKYLLKEATELTAIFTATGRTAKMKRETVNG